MASAHIGITGVNAVDNPGPGVGVARSLKEAPDLDAHLIGLAYDAMEPGVYMDWLFERAFLLPYPSAGHEAFLERMRYIRAATDMNILVPNLDAELPLLIRYGRELEAIGVRMLLPTEEQFTLRAKEHLPEVARKIGLKAPETRVVHSPQELLEGVRELGLPVMVKGVFYGAYRAYTEQEAIGYFHQLVAEWGYPVLVQQVITGEELNVVSVGDGEGGSFGAVGLRKMWVTRLGKIWTGVTVRHEGMLQATERFVATYRWRGPFELECMLQDDDLYLIEINPRFPAWCYFATGVGVNLPARLIRYLSGEEPERSSDYEPGKLYIRYTYELISDMEPFQHMITRGER